MNHTMPSIYLLLCLFICLDNKTMIPGAVEICSRVAGHENICRQISFLKRFDGLAKQASIVKVMVNGPQADRKLALEHTRFLTECRSNLYGVVRYVKTVDFNMFQADIGEDHSLGVLWNLSGVSSFHNVSTDHPNAICLISEVCLCEA